MRSLVFLLLISFYVVVCHRHLLPVEILLEKEDGVEAILEEGEVITPIRFHMNFEGLEDVEDTLRSVYSQYCTSVSPAPHSSSHSSSSRVRSKRSAFDVSWLEGAAVAAVGVVGSIFYPVGAGVGAGVGVMNTMEIKKLDNQMRELYARQIADKFATELDDAFFSHKLSGIMLGGLSNHFINSTGMASIFEVRARVHIYVDHCQGDYLLAHAVHSDPHNTIRGSVYKVADAGNFIKKDSLYVYHELPRELFISEKDDAILTEKCLPSFGSTTICTKKTEVVSKDSCSVYNYEDHCPRIVVNVGDRKSYVRRIGEIFIVVSTRPAALIRNGKGEERKFVLKRGGITIAKLKFDETMELDGMRYHGSSDSTVNVEIDIKEIFHSLPSGLSYEVESGTSKILPSRSELQLKFVYTCAVIGFLIFLALAIVIIAIYKCYCVPRM